MNRILRPVDFDPFVENPSVDLPLTRPQTEVWIESQMGADASCAFNQCYVLRLQGPASAPAMQQAINTVVARHGATRTTYASEGTHQTLRAQQNIELQICDLCERSLEQAEHALQGIVDRETETPFDLAAGPNIRAHLVSITDSEHALVLTVHHIVCDGWSSAVLFSDLAKAYQTAQWGLPPDLPDVMRFSDYIAHTQEPGAFETDKAYWLNQFADGVPTLDLPIDNPRQQMRSRRASRVSQHIDAEVYAALKLAAGRQRATLFHALLAGFEVLLHRLTSAADFVVGVPYAGQQDLGDAHLVAHCVHTLPLRTKIERSTTLATAIQATRNRLIEGQSHASVTFSDLLPELSLDRDETRPPMVPVLFNIDRMGAPFDFGRSVKVCSVEAPKAFVTFEVSVNVVDNGRELTVEWDYNSDLFDAATLTRWSDHYQRILVAISRDAEQPVGDVDLLGDHVRTRMIEDWNATATADDMPFAHVAFAEQARRSPDAVAVRQGDLHIAYAELAARSDHLAHLLQQEGIQRGDFVALCLERTPNLLVAILAILKAGGAYVPIDPALPKERVQRILDNAEPKLMLVEPTTANALPQHAARVLNVSAVKLEDEPGLAPSRVDVSAEDPIYVLYTSGSTGQPKGVVLPHSAYQNFLLAMAHHPAGLRPGDTVAALTTVSFDIAGYELLHPLAQGATLDLIPHDTATDGRTLAAHLDGGAANVLSTTPATWRMLIDAGWRGDGLRLGISIGEELPRDLADEVLARVPEFWNMYGPTETTIWSTGAKVAPSPAPVSIGGPIANTAVYVVDAQGQPCPIGVPGELIIGGAGLATGYHQLPQLTHERFVPDTFSRLPDARLYRTGDLVRWRADGTLDHLGRMDTQVKVRGFRIELGEIEVALREHPDVREAVVVTREPSRGDVRLVAYIVTAPNADLTGTDLRRHLRHGLPRYMIPSMFEMVETFPLNASGKVDRKALPDPFAKKTLEPGNHEPPAGAVEQAFAKIWSEFLHIDVARIGANDMFFDLGGHSLLAIRVARTCEAETGWAMDPRLLFFQSLRQIAALAEAGNGAAPETLEAAQ